jgi:hypothetical protein
MLDLFHRVLSYRISIAALIEVWLWLAIPYITIGLVWSAFHPAYADQDTDSPAERPTRWLRGGGFRGLRALVARPAVCLRHLPDVTLACTIDDVEYATLELINWANNRLAAPVSSAMFRPKNTKPPITLASRSPSQATPQSRSLASNPDG